MRQDNVQVGGCASGYIHLCFAKQLLTLYLEATLYTIQLGLNLVWMPLFFGFNRPIAAAVDIVSLAGTVSYLAYIWGQVDTTSGWLLAPYLAWLGFATYLCVSRGSCGAM
jgi:tryptophan-rich sensory protein